MILTKTKSNLVEKKKHPGKKFSKWNFFIFIVIMIPIIIITFIIPIDNVVDALPTRTTTTTKISRLSPSSSIPIPSFSSEKAQLFEKRNDIEYRVKKSKRSKDKKIRTIINKEEYVKNKRREITITEDLSTTVAPPPLSSDEDQGDYDNAYNGQSRPVLLYWILAIVFVIILIEIMYWTYRLVYRLRYIANNNRDGVNNNNNNNRNQNVSTNVTSNNNRVLGDYVVNGSSVEEELPPYDGLSLPKYTEIVKSITDDNNVTDNNNSSETNNGDR